MVQILPAVQKTPKRTFAQKLNAGIGPALEVATKYYERYKENQALKEKGIDLSDITDPNTRAQVLAQELQQGIGRRRAEASLGANAQGQDLYQKREMPEFETGRKKNNIDLSDIIQEKKNQGSMPQMETSGEKVQVLDPNQLKQLASQKAQFLTQNGRPTTVEEAYQQELIENNQREQHNARVDQDLQKRIQVQQARGTQAVEKLRNVIEKPTDEQEALFRRKGEEAAQAGKSESEIEKMISQEAKNYKNTIANVKRSLGPERLGSLQPILGQSREAEKSKLDLRIKLAPLLNEGQFDTARNLLSELGYHPEERESIITDLPEGARKSLAEFPKLEKKELQLSKPMKSGKFEFETPKSRIFETKPPEHTQEQKRLVYSSMGDILKNDPSTNLILLRRAYDGKNVDWQDFKDALNQNIIEGKIKLNDDQFNHLELLDQPPLTNLDKLLFAGNLIGK